VFVGLPGGHEPACRLTGAAGLGGLRVGLDDGELVKFSV
jgi:hypothetical protein